MGATEKRRATASGVDDGETTDKTLMAKAHLANRERKPLFGNHLKMKKDQQKNVKGTRKK